MGFNLKGGHTIQLLHRSSPHPEDLQSHFRLLPGLHRSSHHLRQSRLCTVGL